MKQLNDYMSPVSMDMKNAQHGGLIMMILHACKEA